MPTSAQRRYDGKGRGAQERASIALGSELLDYLATRGERSGTDTTKQIRFLATALKEGRLLYINGLAEVTHLMPEGGVSEPIAKMAWSQSPANVPKLSHQVSSRVAAAAGDAGRRAEPAPRR